ncbi:subtilisin-like protease [Oryza brachyantha]|uniref:subtilisin-like protease n=1 Tax=Oryza brachyantha TaxID=4533 RepID=UPI001ADC731C|nr:subtilisin-like protease [Oryza brachyantha]
MQVLFRTPEEQQTDDDPNHTFCKFTNFRRNFPSILGSRILALHVLCTYTSVLHYIPIDHMMTSSRIACVAVLAFVLTATSALCYIVTDGAARRQSASASASHGEAQTYIVLVEPPPAHARGGGEDDQAAHRRWHESFLPGAGEGGQRPRPRIRHSYTGVLSGFAATLTGGELDAVSRRPGFVRAFPERRLPLMTTRTPGFLGLAQGRGVWKEARYGEGVVVGLLDTGIDAAHPSFRDDGMPPPPAKWKGACMSPALCNNKLIGATSFVYDNNTVDEVGHGTHTAGTAAGHFVDGVSAFGLAPGTASGMAPGAHLAMYKVCNGQGCFESDVLAGMDAAVKDGVDVLSISLGGPSVAFDKDPIAIGAFGAVSRGISVVCAGGNSGPMPFTLSNEAPWMLTVAAGSVDRSFRATVRLGDGEAFDGESLSQDKRFSSKAYPLYYSQGTNYCDFFDANITGAVVVCDTETPLPPTRSIDAIREAGGAGVVFINEADFGYTIVLEKYYDLPMSQVTSADGAKIMGYAGVGSPAGSHTATIVFNSSVVGVKPAPVVAAFSSRGPSAASPGVPKPDVMAPGLNILAGWPSQVPVGDGAESYSFNVVSGTSMATPHVTGIVALIKKVHPDWSPAMIKSAIMTTSSALDNDGHAIMDEEHRKARFYTVGAGHVDPAKAIDPGLVYDLAARDYAAYICALLGESSLRTITGDSAATCAEAGSVAEAQLNYPAILVPLRPGLAFTVNRTVTNVGPARSRYTARVDAPGCTTVKVEPAELVFKEAMERKTFAVTVTVSGRDGGGAGGGRRVVAEGSLRWVSRHHVVRSPIVADGSVAPKSAQKV